MTGEQQAGTPKAVSRTYMVVIDESDEARVALRFATRRAIKTGGHVLVLAIIPPTEFIQWGRSEEHTSELQSLMRISYAVFCLKKKIHHNRNHNNTCNLYQHPPATTQIGHRMLHYY